MDCSKLVLCLVLVVGFCVGTPESDEILDRLLAEDDIVLTPEELFYRRKIFEGNWLIKPEDEPLLLQDMYTDKEIDYQNGGEKVVIETDEEDAGNFIPDEGVVYTPEKGRSTPLSYDPRSINITNESGEEEPMLLPARNQQNCGNCYLHTFVGALELSYTKATGKKMKFSVQEMTDCYFKGCDGGDFRMVTRMMSYIDKLSSESQYGGYLNGQYTCRKATTPDNLDTIQIIDYVSVSANTLERAVIQYGSVMTCMMWGTTKESKCSMSNYQAGQVVDYPSYPSEGQCDHAVLIVGYTPNYYIVRNSHGVSWGDKGYFLIKRGTNSCGIEDTMAAIRYRVREHVKEGLMRNGCPADKPRYCEDSSSCISELEDCVQSSGSTKTKRSAENVEIMNPQSGCRNLYSDYVCDFLIQAYECGVVLIRGRDFDIKANCLKACEVCTTDGDEDIFVPPSKEKSGSCYRPVIANGRVENTPIMKPNEVLKVICDEGYTLVGKSVRCLIQNVFTNDDKDGRLLPQCVKLGANSFEGSGEEYSGSQSTYVDFAGRQQTCDNWDKTVLRGILMNRLDGYRYQLGNHNYCRNPSPNDYPVPSCLSNGDNVEGVGTDITFCFQHPACEETCVGDLTNKLEDAFCEQSRGSCAFTNAGALENANYYWTYCRKSCCELHC